MNEKTITNLKIFGFMTIYFTVSLFLIAMMSASFRDEGFIYDTFFKGELEANKLIFNSPEFKAYVESDEFKAFTAIECEIDVVAQDITTLKQGHCILDRIYNAVDDFEVVDGVVKQKRWLS